MSGQAAQPPSLVRRLGGHFAALASGALATRLVTLASQIVVARIVGPSAVGALAVAQSVGLIASVFTDGGMTVSAIRSIVRDPLQLSVLVSRTFYGQLLVATLGLVLIDLVAFGLPGGSRAAVLLILFSPALLLSAANISYALTATEMMGSVAYYRIVGSVIPAVLSIILVTWTSDVIWVPVATLVGVAFSGALTYRRARKRLHLTLLRVPLRTVIDTVHSGLSLVTTSALLLVPTIATPVIMGATLGVRAAGLFSVAWQLAFAVIAMSAVACEAVYPEIVRRWDDNRHSFNAFLTVSVRMTARVLLPGVVFVCFAAPAMMNLLFGHRFHGSAAVMRIVVLVVPFGVLWTLVGQAMTAANHEKSQARRTGAVAAVTLVATPVVALNGGLIAATATIVGMSALLLALYMAAPCFDSLPLAAALCREVPYAAAPAAVCALAASVRLIGPGWYAVSVVLGVLLWEIVCGWPTLGLVRQLAGRTGQPA